MMPAVTNTEAANQEKKLSSRVSLVRCLTGLLRGGGGKKWLVINTLPAASVSRPELASTLDGHMQPQSVGPLDDQSLSFFLHARRQRRNR